MIWNKIFLVFRSAFTIPDDKRREVRELLQKRVVRWSECATRNPEIVGDLLSMGGVLAQTIEVYADEKLQRDDPIRMARENGRRDLALELLALTGLNQDEYIHIMEMNNA
jgi:hypothetical protein